jgi:hypothetical protein
MAEAFLGDEIWYTARRVSPQRVDVVKWSAYRTDPIEIYHIFNSKCSCLGALRNPFCRHMKVLMEFRSRQDNGHPVYGFAYSPDHPQHSNILGAAWQQWVPSIDWNQVPLNSHPNLED